MSTRSGLRRPDCMMELNVAADITEEQSGYARTTNRDARSIRRCERRVSNVKYALRRYYLQGRRARRCDSRRSERNYACKHFATARCATWIYNRDARERASFEGRRAGRGARLVLMTAARDNLTECTPTDEDLWNSIRFISMTRTRSIGFSGFTATQSRGFSFLARTGTRAQL